MAGYNAAGDPPRDRDKEIGILVARRGFWGDHILNAEQFNERLCKALNNFDERLDALEEKEK